jgi:exopolyphosphatase
MSKPVFARTFSWFCVQFIDTHTDFLTAKPLHCTYIAHRDQGIVLNSLLMHSQCHDVHIIHCTMSNCLTITPETIYNTSTKKENRKTDNKTKSLGMPRRTTIVGLIGMTTFVAATVTIIFRCLLTTSTVRQRGFFQATSFVLSSSSSSRSPNFGQCSKAEQTCGGGSVSAGTTADTGTTTGRMDLSEFLRERQKHPTRRVVIGNEAGDADSVISAIGWAYLHEEDGDDDVDDDATTAATPIVSISKSDLQTQRPETLYLMRLAGIDTETLLYVDDPVWTDPRVKLDVTLVDHKYQQQQEQYNVVQIIDHHNDEGYHLDARKRTIAFANGTALVASTCTLVVEKDVAMRRRQQQHPLLSASLSILLLGVILLDSVNMDAAAGKGTDRDRVAIQALLQNTAWGELPRDTDPGHQLLRGMLPENVPDTDALFRALQGAKFEPSFWNSLSVKDALRLDYKSFSVPESIQGFGISTVLMQRKDFVNKARLAESIQAYMSEQSVDFFAVMLASTTESGSSLCREIILCGTEQFNMDSLVLFLQSETTLNLNEVREDGTPRALGISIRYFDQGDAKASRKQVAPILIEYFEKNSSLIR